MAGFTIGDYYYYSIASGSTNVSMRVSVKTKTSYADPTGTVTYDGVTYTVTNMNSCFSDCTSLTTPPDLSDMTAVTDMGACFNGCTGLTVPPDLSNMTAVTKMSNCFYGCNSLTAPPDLSNMTAVTNMDGCFYLCADLATPPDLSNMTAVTSMINCFSGCTSLSSPPNMSNMTAVTDMYGCFYNCYSLAAPPDMSNMTAVTNMSYCFQTCTSLTTPPNMSNMAAVTNMSYCFNQCTSLATPPDLSAMTAVTNMSKCFERCRSLSGFIKIGATSDPSSLGTDIFGPPSQAIADTLLLIVPASQRTNWDNYSKPSDVHIIPANVSYGPVTMAPYDYAYSTDANGQLTSLACAVNSSYTSQTSYPPINTLVTNMFRCFYRCTSLATPPDMSNMTAVTNMEGCFEGCSSLATPPDLSNMTAVTSMAYCFKDCSSLATPPDLSNMTAVTKMTRCFEGCSSLATPPDLSNMTAVTNMNGCFYKCSNLTTPPDLSNMTAVTNMGWCFYKCSRLATPPDLSNMTAVTDMDCCFRECSIIFDPPNLSNMTAVTDMSYCFYQCGNLKFPPDLSNMTAVTDMSYCFYNCGSLLAPPDMSNMAAVTSMSYCFYWCNMLTTPPDMSNMTEVTRMDWCFFSCNSLKRAPDLFNMTKVTDISNCFRDCMALIDPPDLSNMTALTNMAYCFSGCLSFRGFLKIGTETAPSSLGYDIFGDSTDFRYEDFYLIVPSSQRTNWTNYSKPSTVKVIAANAMSDVNYNFGYDVTVYTYLYETDSSGQLTRLNCIAINAPFHDGTYYDFPPIDRNTTDLGACFASTNTTVYTWKERYSNEPNGLKYPSFAGLRHVTYMGDCFSGCLALTTPPDLSDMTAVTVMEACFSSCGLTSPPNMSDMTAVTNMCRCFGGCTSLTTPPDMSNMTAVTDMSSCFAGCMSLVVPPDMSNMTAVTDMGSCFIGCDRLVVPPDLSSLAAVTNMGSCFNSCSSLTTSPNMSGMVSVTDMDYCFAYCTSLTTPPDLSDMTAVTDMNNCFIGCSSLEASPDMSNMTAVTSMVFCFRDCSSLTTPPDMSNMTAVTNMNSCFSGCTSLTAPPDMSNMTAVTSMSQCFYNCTALSGDLRVGSRVLSSGANAFTGTAGNIWIVPTEDVTGTGTALAPASSGDAAWFNLYSQGNGMPANVHFYSPYLNAAPTSGLSVQRIEGFDGYFIEAPTGAILMETVMKPQVYATRVKTMPTVRKISIWVGSAEDEQYIRDRLSIDEDTGYAEVRQVLYDQDPSALGYYEYDSANDDYVSTSDTSPVSGKKYYTLVDGEALSRGLGFTKILYRPNPDAPNDLALLRMGDLSLYTNGDYADMALAPSTLTFDRFYAFLTRDTTTQVVALFVEDSCHNVSKYVVKIPKSFATFSFLKPGGGVGVGIPARRKGFDVDMQAFFECNPMVYDVPTLPVVVTYASTIADDAHLPDPCLVIRIDPGYLWSRANPSAPIPNDGFQIYLRGSMLERLPQRAGRAFVTTPPLSGGGTGWTVLGSAMGEAKVDTYLPGNVPVSSSQADRWTPASGAGQLLVSVTGCEKVAVEFQNGNDSDGTGGAHFELYGIDTSYVQGAVPVATSTSDESYTFTHLESKPHTFEVRPVPDSSQHSSETNAPTAYVRIVPDPES